MLLHSYQKSQIAYELWVTHYRYPIALVWVELWPIIWILRMKLQIMVISMKYLLWFPFFFFHAGVLSIFRFPYWLLYLLLQLKSRSWFCLILDTLRLSTGPSGILELFFSPISFGARLVWPKLVEEQLLLGRIIKSFW